MQNITGGGGGGGGGVLVGLVVLVVVVGNGRIAQWQAGGVNIEPYGSWGSHVLNASIGRHGYHWIDSSDSD